MSCTRSPDAIYRLVAGGLISALCLSVPSSVGVYPEISRGTLRPISPRNNAGLEEQIQQALKGEVPLLTHVPFQGLDRELNDWLIQRGEIRRVTQHYGESRIAFRVVQGERKNAAHVLVAAIAMDEWVNQHPELDDNLGRNGLWDKYFQLGRGLVHLYLSRYRSEDGTDAIAIERVQILANPLRLEHAEDVEVRSDALTAIGEWGRQKKIPVFLIRPEVIRQARRGLKEKTIFRNYYKPVDQQKPRLWETVRLKIRGSPFFTEEEREDDWFRYVGSAEQVAWEVVPNSGIFMVSDAVLAFFAGKDAPVAGGLTVRPPADRGEREGVAEGMMKALEKQFPQVSSQSFEMRVELRRRLFTPGHILIPRSMDLKRLRYILEHEYFQRLAYSDPASSRKLAEGLGVLKQLKHRAVTLFYGTAYWERLSPEEFGAQWFRVAGANVDEGVWKETKEALKLELRDNPRFPHRRQVLEMIRVIERAIGPRARREVKRLVSGIRDRWQESPLLDLPAPPPSPQVPFAPELAEVLAERRQGLSKDPEFISGVARMVVISLSAQLSRRGFGQVTEGAFMRWMAGHSVFEMGASRESTQVVRDLKETYGAQKVVSLGREGIVDVWPQGPHDVIISLYTLNSTRVPEGTAPSVFYAHVTSELQRVLSDQGLAILVTGASGNRDLHVALDHAGFHVADRAGGLYLVTKQDLSKVLDRIVGEITHTAGLEEVAEPIGDFEEVGQGVAEWMEQNGRIELQTNSPKLGKASAFLKPSDEVWRYKFEVRFPEEWTWSVKGLRRLWGQPGGDIAKPGFNAAWQIRIGAYRFTSGPREGMPFILIEEVQPGDEYRRVSHSIRRHLDPLLKEAVLKVAQWAESRNLLVYAATPSVMRRMIPKLDRTRHEAEKYYGRRIGPFDPKVWKSEILSIHHRMIRRVHGRHRWNAYRGNDRIERRLREAQAGAQKSVWVPELKRDLKVIPGVLSLSDSTSRSFLQFILRNPQFFQGKRFLDLGTGTGVLAIGLARVGATVVAVDLLSEAVSNASDNLAAESPEVRARVTVGQSDLYKNLASITGEENPQFDGIVFNNPFSDSEPSPGDARSYAIYAGKGFRLIHDAIDGFPALLRLGGNAYMAAFGNRIWAEELWNRSRLEAAVPAGWKVQQVDPPLQASGEEPRYAIFRVHRPAAGLEEMERVPFQHSSDQSPLMERQVFDQVGLGDWLDPMTPFEAAVLKAFVHNKYSVLPGMMEWERGLRGELIPVPDSFSFNLNRDELAVFLNNLYQLEQLRGSFDEARMRQDMGSLFRETVLRMDTRTMAAPKDSDAAQQILADHAFWSDQFSQLLGQIRSLKSHTKPFGLFDLQRIGDRYYQRVGPSGRLEVPLALLKEETAIWVRDRKLLLKRPPPFSLWQFLDAVRQRWQLLEADGKMIAKFSSDQPFRLSGVGNDLLLSVASRELAGGRSTPVLLMSDLGQKPERDILIERPGEAMVRTAVDMQIEEAHDLLSEGKVQKAILKVLAVLDDVSREVRPAWFFSHWDLTGSVMKKAGEVLLSSGLGSGLRPYQTQFLTRVIAELLKVQPQEGGSEAFKQFEETRRNDIAKVIMKYQAALGYSPVVDLDKFWFPKPEGTAPAGLEESPPEGQVPGKVGKPFDLLLRQYEEWSRGRQYAEAMRLGQSKGGSAVRRWLGRWLGAPPAQESLRLRLPGTNREAEFLLLDHAVRIPWSLLLEAGQDGLLVVPEGNITNLSPEDAGFLRYVNIRWLPGFDQAGLLQAEMNTVQPLTGKSSTQEMPLSVFISLDLSSSFVRLRDGVGVHAKGLDSRLYVERRAAQSPPELLAHLSDPALDAEVRDGLTLALALRNYPVGQEGRDRVWDYFLTLVSNETWYRSHPQIGLQVMIGFTRFSEPSVQGMKRLLPVLEVREGHAEDEEEKGVVKEVMARMQAGLEERSQGTKLEDLVFLWGKVQTTPAYDSVRKFLPIFSRPSTFQAIPLVARAGLPFVVLAATELEEQAVQALLDASGVPRQQYVLRRVESREQGLERAMSEFSARYATYPVNPDRPNWLQELLAGLEEIGVIPVGDLEPALQRTQEYFAQFV